MKQLELDFNSINLSDHYDAYRVIDKGKNQICNWSDSLSDDGKKISYDEYTYNTTQCMDFENWIHINKNGLGKSAFKWFFMYLKSINGRADRLEKLKRVLNDMDIPFEEGDWQTIDRDCEREDSEKYNSIQKTNNKIDQQKGYIIYYQEIKTSKGIVKLEIKILKTDVNNLQKQLIKNQIDNLVKLYPLEYFKKLRFYLKLKDIPFIAKFPFQEHKGYMITIFKPNETAENYYENENGDLQEVKDEMLDWQLYDGTFKKKPSKLRIIK